jgi:hypothetical protein
MPIRDTLKQHDVADEKQLRTELEAELRSPKDTGEPEIVIERTNPATTHLFVIWSKWEHLVQMVRSRIILDAYAGTMGDEETNKVTVSMGLTPDEASRLGIT